MVKVNCTIKNESDKGPREVQVNSVSNDFGTVEIRMSDAVVRVWGNDLIQATENAMNRGRRRYRPYDPARQNNAEDEEEE